MAEQNRVLPTGAIEAVDLRCRWMGNRGLLHRGTTREIVRPWRSRAWITCALSYKGWRQPQWADGRCTILFFADEAVALAAGHRPCALCRRPAYDSFCGAWARAFGGDRPRAPEVDERLHADRLDGRAQRTHRRGWRELPDGAFALLDGVPCRVEGDALHPWVPSAPDVHYAAPQARPRRGDATVLTPSCTVEVLRAAYAHTLVPP